MAHIFYKILRPQRLGLMSICVYLGFTFPDHQDKTVYTWWYGKVKPQ